SLEGRAELTLRSEEDRGLRRHLLAFVDSGEDFDVSAQTAARRDPPGLEVPVADCDEDDLLGAGIEHGIGGDDDAGVPDVAARASGCGGSDLDRRVHPGLETAAAVAERVADLVRAALFVDIGVDVDHTAGEA